MEWDFKMYCKDCKYWKTRGFSDCVIETDNQQLIMKQCCCPRWLYGYGYYKKLRDGDISVEDDEGWGAFTSEHFGCIHFQRRDPGAVY